MSSRESDEFSTEIVKRRDTNNVNSVSFSIRVKPKLPDFLSSVNMKYVKLGYGYLITHPSYFFLLLLVPLLVAVISMASRNNQLFTLDFTHVVLFILPVLLFLYSYSDDLTSRSTYLLDFACFRPPNEFKVLSSFFDSMFSFVI